MKLEQGHAADEVYIICRVYNLGQEDIGFCVYVDPESMRLDDELKFTPDAYAVTPIPKRAAPSPEHSRTARFPFFSSS
jgi:hypothetical protein